METGQKGWAVKPGEEKGDLIAAFKCLQGSCEKPAQGLFKCHIMIEQGGNGYKLKEEALCHEEIPGLFSQKVPCSSSINTFSPLVIIKNKISVAKIEWVLK